MLVSDRAQRRETILNVLKKDVYEYSDFISNALKNEDSETSHYAASSMLHMRRVLDVKMREISKIYNENPRDFKAAMEYFEIVDRYMAITDLDAGIREMYTQESIKCLKRIVDSKGLAPQRYIFRLIELLIRTGNHREANIYCDILYMAYKDNEEKYLALLKSYYQMKNKASFDLVLHRLEGLEIALSHNTTEIIRFWVDENKEYDEEDEDACQDSEDFHYLDYKFASE
ncbi:hypothetical protein [Anaerotalea alkaliphila]|uniref:Uncharacterized protein n=1 Tax=Anaerotalea alkaliphila TaxID=2662126 RepID=A0A7X5HY18_9FIRM|nr:hypothetical protein [Anaerotalea alkaliphila]NDL68710.1 hypothetical protein [Anaerotalea alkaliphila]